MASRRKGWRWLSVEVGPATVHTSRLICVFAQPLITHLLPCWGHCTFATGTGLPLTICVPQTHLVSRGVMFAEPSGRALFLPCGERCWKAFLRAWTTDLGLSASRHKKLISVVHSYQFLVFCYSGASCLRNASLQDPRFPTGKSGPTCSQAPIGGTVHIAALSGCFLCGQHSVGPFCVASTQWVHFYQQH